MKARRAPVGTSAAEATAPLNPSALSASSRVSTRGPRSKFPVKQPIFTGTTIDGGAEVALVSLTDDRCALIRDGVLIAAWATDAYGIDEGVRQYLELIQHPPLGSAPPSVETPYTRRQSY